MEGGALDPLPQGLPSVVVWSNIALCVLGTVVGQTLQLRLDIVYLAVRVLPNLKVTCEYVKPLVRRGSAWLAAWGFEPGFLLVAVVLYASVFTLKSSKIRIINLFMLLFCPCELWSLLCRTYSQNWRG